MNQKNIFSASYQYINNLLTSIISSTNSITSGGDITANGKYLNLPRYIYLNSGANLITLNYLGCNFQSSTLAFAQFQMSNSCNVTAGVVKLNIATGAGQTRLFFIQKNGATSGTMTITNGSSASWSGNMSFVAGDLLSVYHIASGSPTASAAFVTLTYFNI